MTDKPVLEKEELRRLDDFLDSYIQSLPFDGMAKADAVVSLLTLHELNLFHALPQDLQLSGHPNHAVSRAQAVLQDSLQFALNWIFQYCTDRDSETEITDPRVLWNQMDLIYSNARKYASIWGIMTGLHKGKFVGRKVSDVEYAISYPDSQLHRCYITDVMLYEFACLSDLGLPSATNLMAAVPEDDVASHISANVEGAQIQFVFCEKAFARLKEAARLFLADTWRLDPGLSFGTYGVSDFQEFWAVIQATAWLQKVIWIPLIAEYRRPQLFTKLVRRQTRAEWIREITANSNLDPSVVSDILHDLTYRGTDDVRQDAGSQPFIQLHRDWIALSNTHAVFLDCERAFWFLLSKRDPVSFGTVTSKKEGAWLKQLVPYLESIGFKVYGPLNYEKGDLDLIVLDEKERFGIVCELKWPMSPDGLAQEFRVRTELLDGRSQIERALRWIRNSLPELASRLKVDESYLLNFELKPLVISKTIALSEASNDVPVVSEALVREYLSKTSSLRVMWSELIKKDYLANEGIHYRITDASVTFAGITFNCEGTAFEPIAKWSLSV